LRMVSLLFFAVIVKKQIDCIDSKISECQ